jgi:hypothetical protein
MEKTTFLAAYVLIASFAIERLLVAAKFFLDGWPPKEDDKDAARRRKLLTFALAGALAVAVVDRGDLRILRTLGGDAKPIWWLDYWLTWLVVVAGADRIREFLGGPPKAQSKEAVPPVKIVLDDGNGQKEIRPAA